MDLFDRPEKRKVRFSTRNLPEESRVPHSEMHIRMIFPAELATAFVTSVLKHQAQSTEKFAELTSKHKHVSEKRKRKNASAGTESISDERKKTKNEASSSRSKTKQNTAESGKLSSTRQV